MPTQAVIQLIDQPPIPTIAFRPFRGEADYPAIAELVTLSNAADQIEEVRTAADVAHDFSHLEGCDLTHDCIFAEVETSGKPVGFSRVAWRLNIEGQRIYLQAGFVLPEWRRMGIGRALLHYTQQRAQAHAQVTPFAGPSVLRGEGEDTALGKIALFEAEGYQPVRYFFFMQRLDLLNLPEAPLPPGIGLRPVEPEALRPIWDAKEEAFRDHWGYTEKSEAAYQHWCHRPLNDSTLWQIAWDEAQNQVAGLSLNVINAANNHRYNFKRGLVDVLGVRRAYRGQGLARALLVNSLRVLRERGMTEVVLGVDAENPTGALRLYQSVGFTVLNQDTAYQKDLG